MESKIRVIGLGGGNMEQLSLGIYRQLKADSNNIFARTLDHPVISELKEEGVSFTGFDEIYEKHDDFQNVYLEIVNILLEEAKDKIITYAVPGHPMLAEKTIQLLLAQTEVPIEIIGGQSYLDALFTSLKIDPIDGFLFVDATDFKRSQLDFRHHLVFCQVYDQFTASEVKLTLLEDLPPDYKVTIIEAAGSKDEKISSIPLVELDHQVEISNLTSVYVPKVPDTLLYHTFPKLREVIAELRGPNGCPWDKEQTHESLRKYAVEEVYELIDAIDQKDDDGITEELGDILLQVMLHSQIGEDNGYFMIDDVIRSITKKMIHRHPHVFGDKEINTVEELYQTWDTLKKEEKGEQRTSLLDGVPRSMPSLAKAAELQQKAAKVGFDFEDVNSMWLKVDEEQEEVKAAIMSGNIDLMEDEFGDVLFALVNLARYYKINPEIALNRTNRKFTARFSYVEQAIKKQGEDIKEITLEKMDSLWEEAKRNE